MFALFYNQSENLNINEEKWDYLIKNSDLKQKNNKEYTPLMYALFYNQSENLNLTIKQWDYFIKNSDLTQTAYGWSPLMYTLNLNKDENLNFNQEQINYLIKQSDLTQINNYGLTILMYGLYNNKTQNLKLTKIQFQEMYYALDEEKQQTTFEQLIQENDINKYQYIEEINLFLYDFKFQPNEKTLSWLTKNNHQDILEMIEKRDLFFELNQVKLMDKKEKTESNEKILEIMNKEDDLSEEEIKLFKELIYQCNLKIQNEYGDIPLMYVLRYNQSKDLNLNEKQINYLIKNSAFKQQNKDGWTTLMYAFLYNQDQNLNLNEEQFDYLIKNSDLKQQNNSRDNLLTFALIYNKEKGLKLTKTQFKILYDALDEEEQQTTFQKLIQTNIENNYQYQKEINLLLFDCEFKPNEETMNWLKENQHQDILERIEKINLFFQLNQELKEIDNHQKYKIK